MSNNTRCLCLSVCLPLSSLSQTTIMSVNWQSKARDSERQSEEAWLSDLADLFSNAQSRYSDISWKQDGGEDELVYAHKGECVLILIFIFTRPCSNLIRPCPKPILEQVSTTAWRRCKRIFK